MKDWLHTLRTLPRDPRTRPILLWWVVPNLLIFASLVLFRLRIIAQMGLTASEAFAAGLGAGIIGDLSLAVLAPALAAALWAIAFVPPLISWTVVAAVVWISGLANVLYFGFFEIRLDLWTLKVHWRDLAAVQTSAVDLSDSLITIASAACFVGALFVQWRGRKHRPYRPGHAPDGATRKRRLLVRARPALVLILLMLACGRGQKATGLSRSSTVVTDTVLRWWWRQATSNFDYRAADPNWESNLPEQISGIDLDATRDKLVAYRSLPNPTTHIDSVDEPVLIPPPPGQDHPEWPLLRSYRSDPKDRAAIRNHLGLPEDGPINIFFLFLESVRAYELQDPELGPLIFPRFNEFLSSRGLHFTQAYSSALNAGQTVRGQFSTQCSTLPNIGGAATYIAHTHLRTRCLPSVLGDNGYRTVWTNTYSADFHRKRTFELLHGMQEFYDVEYWKERIDQIIGTWGLADGPFLKQSLELLGEIRAEGQPFYVNALTISTHHPFTAVPEGPVPEPLATKYIDNKSYLGYLSRLVYLDGALSDFLQAFFEHPLSKDTLLVVLGDHGAPVLPSKDTPPVRWQELRFRIPLAIFTGGLGPGSGRKIHRQVHQMDIAPTVARVVGLQADVPWLGRGLFAREGSPWIWKARKWVSYRVGNRACYRRFFRDQPRCLDVSSGDPMFDEQVLPRLELDDAETEYFADVVRANLALIALNALLPPGQR